MFREGQQIGLYTLIQKIGKGGFGEVWLAEKRTELVTKKVAIKLPLDEQVNIETVRQEAGLWEQASGHPNVLPIIDADICNGQVIIVSEYAAGGSLAEKLKINGRLPIKEAIEITIGILNGLEYLHSKRIIHRDIKPANILLQGNTPRLADFGISRAMQTASASSTIIGTDAYMSPEAFEGKRNIQTDIWSVGVVLYQLLTGNLPFPQEHPTERMFAVLMKEPEPLPDTVPSKLKEIINKALEKDRDIGQNSPKRYQTTAQMREDLQNFLITLSNPVSNQQTKILPKSVINKSDSVVTVITPVKPKTHHPEKPSNNKDKTPKPLIIGVAVIVLGLFTGSLLWLISYLQGNEVPSVSSNISKPFNNLVNSNVNRSVSNSANRLINPNTSSSTGSPVTEINVEFKTNETVAVSYWTDGRLANKNITTAEPLIVRPQQSVKLRYYRGFADKVQLIVNGKRIRPPAAPEKGAGIEFEINKDNITQILQSGRISAATP